jgi:hypothetical protein
VQECCCEKAVCRNFLAFSSKEDLRVRGLLLACFLHNRFSLHDTTSATSKGRALNTPTAAILIEWSRSVHLLDDISAGSLLAS